MPATFTITGLVKDDHEQPLARVTIRAYDRDLRSAELLGEALTDGAGEFKITYSNEQFRRAEKKSADLVVRVFADDEREYLITYLVLNDEIQKPPTRVLFNVPEECRLIVMVGPLETPALSEYERLVAEVTPLLDGVTLADLTNADVDFLSGDLETPDKPALYLRVAHGLARHSGVAAEAFYAWLRVPHPGDWTQLPITSDGEAWEQALSGILEALRGTADGDLVAMLRSQAEEQIVPAWVGEKAEELVRGLKRSGQQVYRLALHLSDAATDEPLALVSVELAPVAPDTISIAPQNTITDPAGRLDLLRFAPPETDVETVTEFSLQVRRAPDDDVLATVEASAPLGQAGPIELRLDMPSRPTPKLAELEAQAGISLPAELRAALDARQIHTLADVRHAGGLNGLAHLPAVDPVIASRIDALADLDRLTPDLDVSTTLLDRNFANVQQIANTPRPEFVARVKDTIPALDEPAAIGLHQAASAQTALLDNALAAQAADQANGFKPMDAQVPLPLDAPPAQRCGCEDCESALSPAAYLAELLDYALKNVRNDGQRIDMAFLERHFHQPFGDLPIDCDSVERRVRQVRLGVEVLRACLGERPLDEPAREKALADAESAYLSTAYTGLLAAIGTSYAELHRAVSAKPDGRAALAARLGVPLTPHDDAQTPRNDELDQLLVEPDQLDEATLERLFGLADTTRDPLSDGVKQGDDPADPWVTRWNLRGVRWNRDTDADGTIYVRLSRPNAGAHVELYRDTEHKVLVAAGEIASAAGEVHVLPQGESDVSGVLTVSKTDGAVHDFSIAAIPAVLSWQLQRLRTLWQAQDHPRDAYSEDAEQRLPVIDPDLIGPDDFRDPDSPTYKIWEARRRQMDGELDRLAAQHSAQERSQAITQALGADRADLERLNAILTDGKATREQIADAQQHLPHYGLTTGALARLLEIDARLGDDTTISEEEWADASGIMVQMGKVQDAYQGWIAEEDQLAANGGEVLLSPRVFSPTLSEPVEGEWPPRPTSSHVWIDPGRVKPSEQPNSGVGQTARELWAKRNARRIEIYESLRTTRETAGLDAMLRQALGDPNPGDPLPVDIKTLQNALTSDDKKIVDDARRTIEDELFLTVEDFQRLLGVVSQNETHLLSIGNATWVEVYQLLTAAQVAKRELAAWRQAEQNLELDRQYWRAVKARLPQWRASADARQSWLAALAARSQPPIIDPTIVDPNDLADPDPAAPSYRLWQGRTAQLAGWRQELADQHATQPGTAGLDLMLQTALGIPGAAIGELEAQQHAGHSISGRLAQLTLTPSAFASISKLWQTLESGEASQVLASEWENLIEILVDVKRQRSFADWRQAEERDQISLSPDFFRARDPLAPGVGSTVSPSAWSARHDWEDRLAQRVEQERSTIEAMGAAASAVEEQALPQLRAALIDACDTVGATAAARSAWLAKRLLIGLQDDGCRMTTRVEQAVETIQGLLWGLSTGQFGPDMRPGTVVSLCAVARGARRMSLFARSGDDHLWQRDWAGHWHPWQDLGLLPTVGQASGKGIVTLQLAAAAWGVDRVDIFVVGNDRALWQKTFDSAWTDWQSLGGGYQGRPAVVAHGDGQVDVFLTNIVQKLLTVSHKIMDHGTWSDGQDSPEKPHTSPCAASWGPDRIDVFFDITPSISPLHRWWDGAWHSESLDGHLGRCVAVTWGENRLDLLKNEAGRLWHRGWDGAWQPWQDLDTNLTLPHDDSIPATEPAACARQVGRIDVFLPRTGADNRVWWRVFDLDTGWEAWQPVEDVRMALVAAPEHFDATWKWLGSYASWRAAMFVYLYPENLLQPNLRQERQTPAFRDLVAAIPAQADPAGVCEAASAYAMELEDICSLEVEATCQVPGEITGGDACRPEQHSADFFHMFARAISRNVYWCRVDPEDMTGFRQSFWEHVPDIANVESIVGALPSYADRRYAISLFVVTRERGAASLKAARLDVNSQTWSPFSPLEVPGSSVDSLDIIPVQTNRLYPGDSPPRIAFHIPGSSTIDVWWLDSDEARWSPKKQWTIRHPKRDVNGEWYGDEPVDMWRLLAVAEYGVVPYLIFTNKLGQLIVRRRDSDSSLFRQSWETSGAETLGVVISEQHPGAYVFYRRDGRNYFRHTGSQLEYATMQDLKRVVPHAGEDRSGEQMLCYVSQRSGQPFYLRYQQETKDRLSGRWAYPARPDWNVRPENLTPATDSSRQNDRTNRNEKAIDDNAAALPGTLAYLQEATFFVPLHLALQLQRSGYYLEALDWFRTVYDYTAKLGERAISFVFDQDAQSPDGALLAHGADWLHDALDPHRIATTRRYAYTRFTVMAIVRCLLDYADAEFTADSGESLARAHTLYQTALDLLDVPVLRQSLEGCDALVAELRVLLGAAAPPEAQPGVGALAEKLTQGGVSGDTLERFKGLLGEKMPWPEQVKQLVAVAKEGRSQATKPVSVSSAVVSKSMQHTMASLEFLQHPGMDQAVQKAGAGAAPAPTPAALAPPVGLPSFNFCVPPNPAIRTLHLHAESNLAKLQSCRNIAGMKRELDLYGAPTDSSSGMPLIGAGGQLTLPGASGVRPTLYRYAVLIERAKQLVQLAAQIEAPMLATLEKRDADAYDLLKARQELGMAQAQVTLQQLRVTEAQSGVELARRQQGRSQVLLSHYTQLLAEGISQTEQEAIKTLDSIAKQQATAADTQFTATIFHGLQYLAGMNSAKPPEQMGVLAQGFSSLANTISAWATKDATRAAVLQMRASYERRQQEWQLQQSLAQQDMAIAAQQITIADQHVDVVSQERHIAELQASNASAAIEFLGNKFTNQELYDWMAGVLEGVYRTFLQQATAMAKLAEAQLAFERQEAPLSQIKADYWTVASGDTLQTTGGNAPDRRGLTGSARLLQDIYQLDQYAFDTDKRKLQITRTMSLAQLAPVEFQRFRETGVLPFTTPMELFDYDFPGHYLRLIRRVRTSVVALIPPDNGIRATLANSGISRVMVGNMGSFQLTTIRRDPEMVALSAPIGATGLFELESQPGAMYLPFENNGVDTSWEFRLPKASNPFDFRTIADVLVTIEYTALNSFDYQQQIIQQLNPTVRADRAFSLRTQFPDAWYDLHNPELLEDSRRMQVSLPVTRDDFPPNLNQIRVGQVLLYVARAEGMTDEVTVERLSLSQSGMTNSIGGGGHTIDGVISTRRGNGAAWLPVIGMPPFGTWELVLPDTPETHRLFKEELVEDILLVVSYSGRIPPWPA